MKYEKKTVEIKNETKINTSIRDKVQDIVQFFQCLLFIRNSKDFQAKENKSETLRLLKIKGSMASHRWGEKERQKWE